MECDHPNEWREIIVIEDYRISHCCFCGTDVTIEKYDSGNTEKKEGDEYVDKNGDIQQRSSC